MLPHQVFNSSSAQAEERCQMTDKVLMVQSFYTIFHYFKYLIAKYYIICNIEHTCISVIIIKWSIYQRLSSLRRSPTSLVTCWTQWGLLGKCLNTWTERLWSAQMANSNLISWEDTSASRVSTSPILQTPTKQCCRWECNTGGLVNVGVIVLSIYSVRITTFIMCFRTFHWSWSLVRWWHWWVHLEKEKVPAWVCWSVSTSLSREKSCWMKNR